MKLLVTYDGSPESAAVFAPAVRLARAFSAELVLLRVHDPGIEDKWQGEQHLASIEGRWCTELRAACARLDYPAEAVCRRLGGRWTVDLEIEAAARDLGADMIIMATHGESALRHFFIGSVALSVLGRSVCPVALVRSDAQRKSLGAAQTRRVPRMLVTFDGSPASAAVFAPAANIANASGAETFVARVYHPVQLEVALQPDRETRETHLIVAERAMRTEIEDFAARIGHELHPVIKRLEGERQSVVEQILAIAEETEADLICMATRGHGAIRHLLIGSTALEVLAKSDVPVMLAPPKRRARVRKTADGGRP